MELSIATSIELMLREYVDTYMTFSEEAIVRYYRLPTMFLSPLGAAAATSRHEALAVVRAMVAHSRATGHSSTAILDLRVRRIADTMAEAVGVYQRFGADGTPAERSAFLYVLVADATGWKIAVAVAH